MVGNIEMKLMSTDSHKKLNKPDHSNLSYADLTF